MADALLDWYGENARDLPWRRTRDPYGIWVSEIMLQQTQVRTVIPYWERWMREFPDARCLAEAAQPKVLKLWEGLGYYRRARNLQAGARRICEVHAGAFPTRFDDVLALPGVGRYTAGAVCSIAFNQPTPILDGNVIRVLSRFGAKAGNPKNPQVNRLLWEESQSWIHAAVATGRPLACSHLNQGLMELGAVVCTPRSPECGRCPLRPGCQAFAKGRPESYPVSAARVKATPREYAVAIIVSRDRVWLRQRSAELVNGGLWEFPNVEVTPGGDGGCGALNAVLGLLFPEGAKPFHVVRHAITRYRVTQKAFLVRWSRGGRPVPGGGAWYSRQELEGLPVSSAHRKIAMALERSWRDELHPA